jgi:hypothetical protein
MTTSGLHHAARLRWLAAALGVFSFAAVLTVFNFTDGDLWAKLALGAHMWICGSILPHDVFAFTPVLPEYIDHEWGAGFIFYACLKWFGPDSLMVLKLFLAFGALTWAMLVGRRLGCDWNTLLALAIPCGACIVPAYAPVLRSHAFTFFFFGLTLFCLEEIRRGKRWPAVVIPVILLVWANVHGGFASGLGTVGVYTAFALLDLLRAAPASGARAQAAGHFKLMLLVAAASFAVSIINPYGFRFWHYLLPALLMNRTILTEWQPLPLLGHDVFFGFRILFVLVIVILLLSWRQTAKKSWPGLAMLVLTAILPWHSRRHAAFFGVSTLAFAGPFAAVACRRVVALVSNPLDRRLPNRQGAKATGASKETGGVKTTGASEETRSGGLETGLETSDTADLEVRATVDRINPALAVLVLYGLLAVYAAVHFLPRSSFQVLSPVGFYPVREVDILSRAGAEGNLAVPFWQGSYATWRLYPRIKVSMDGRYEASYPEASFRLNEDFFSKTGADWDRLIREYPVDYVILDFESGRLRPEDLESRGYVLIWVQEGRSALLALEKHAAQLRAAAASLPATTVEPLDASIPEKWWEGK